MSQRRKAVCARGAEALRFKGQVQPLSGGGGNTSPKLYWKPCWYYPQRKLAFSCVPWLWYKASLGLRYQLVGLVPIKSPQLPDPRGQGAEMGCVLSPG